VQFYPPGVLFIATSLGLVALATVRHDLLIDPLELAATIAHEMRTPLATISSQSRVLSNSLPELLAGYQRAIDHGLLAPTLRPDKLAYPFYTTRQGGGGSGMGLAFCQRVFTAFGGQILC
jgi:two-component system CAI-1 autoinducer sensor kinase/phosphatase CqsS